MITKEAVIAKLDALIAYSNAQQPANYASVAQPVYDAVNTYFSTSNPDLKKAVQEYIFQEYCDIDKRNQVWSDPYPYNFDTVYPVGYNDLRQCFYTFPLLEVSNEDFFAAWQWQTQGGDSGSGTSTKVPVSNTYLTQWQADITAAPREDVTRVNNVVNWLKNTGDGYILIDLFNDQGEYISSKTSAEIAKIIYLDRHAKEVINERNLNVYIPEGV